MPLKDYSAFSWEGVKRNPVVSPIVFCIGLGVTMAAAYTLRLAIKCPDVTWRKNPAPWNDYEHKEYKFVQMEPFDVKNYQHPRPRF